jgi:hypothetical protein
MQIQRTIHREYLLITLLYVVALILLFMQASPHHVFSGVTLDWNWTISYLEKTFQGNDVGDFTSVAHALYRDGTFPPNSIYSFRLWAPGIYWLFALPLFIQGEDAPVLIYMSVFNLVLWCLLLFIIYDALRGFIPRVLAFFLPLLIFILPEMKDFVLRAGIINSDAYAASSFALATIALFLAFERGSRHFAWLAGIAFTFSAYMRAAHEPWNNMLCLTLLLLVLFEYSCISGVPIFRCRKSLFKQCYSWAKHVSTFRTAFFIVVVIVVTMAPWRIHNLFNDYRLSWGVGPSYDIANTWLQRETNHWYYVSGGTIGCQIDPQTCEEFNRHGLHNVKTSEKIWAYFRTLLTHPFSWMRIKIHVFTSQWMADYGNPTSNPMVAWMRALLLGLFAILPVYSFYLFAWAQKTPVAFARMWLTLTLLGYTSALLLLAHIEERYLYPMKLMVYYWFLFEIVRLIRTWKITSS